MFLLSKRNKRGKGEVPWPAHHVTSDGISTVSPKSGGAGNVGSSRFRGKLTHLTLKRQSR